MTKIDIFEIAINISGYDISQAVRGADKISMTKNIFGEGSVQTPLTTEKSTGFKRNTADVWQKYGYFKQELRDFGTEKDNIPENSEQFFLIKATSLIRITKTFTMLTTTFSGK